MDSRGDRNLFVSLPMVRQLVLVLLLTDPSDSLRILSKQQKNEDKEETV